MKNFKYIPFFIIALLVTFMASCARDFDEPTLNEPKYVPDASKKVISVKEFKAMYADVANETNKQIKGPYVLKATVVGNDVSGNIFKKLFVQDYDKQNPQAAGMSGLYLGVDQNNVSNTYVVGQDVYVELDGLYAVNYGEDLQIGYGTTNANRIPWNIFQEHVKRNNWANPNAIKPRKVKISELTEDMANTLVTFEDVVFDEGGKGYFITPNTTQDTNQNFSDGTGKIVLRTSSYFSNIKNEMLPVGKGSLTGILGVHKKTWQLYLRDKNDIGEFDGQEVVEPEEKDLIFKENFGTPAKDGTKWPTVAEYTGYQSADKFKYTDPYGTAATLRYVAGMGNIYFPVTTAEKPAAFKIEGLPANQKKLVMVYDMMGQSENPAMNFSGFIDVKADGKDIPIPNKAIARDAWSKITVALPDNTTSVEFFSGAKNTGGMRVANVKIYCNSDLVVDPTSPIDPVDPVDPVDPTDQDSFKETFGTPKKGDKGWPYLSDYEDFDMKAPVKYIDVNKKLTVRVTGSVNNIWFPANGDNTLRIENINTKKLTSPVLKFKVAADTGTAGQIDLNSMKVSINGKDVPLKSTPVSAANGDTNKFYDFEIEGEVPVSENVTIDFSANAPSVGLRLAEIIIANK